MFLQRVQYIFEVYPQRYKQTSKKHEVYFNVFHDFNKNRRTISHKVCYSIYTNQAKPYDYILCNIVTQP